MLLLELLLFFPVESKVSKFLVQLFLELVL